jgi:hypothetical protein
MLILVSGLLFCFGIALLAFGITGYLVKLVFWVFYGTFYAVFWILWQIVCLVFPQKKPEPKLPEAEAPAQVVSHAEHEERTYTLQQNRHGTWVLK